MREVAIGDGSIRLGQLLKLAGFVDVGADAKLLLASGEVSVNDEVDLRRGRQVVPGDVVSLGELSVRVVRAEPA